MEHHYVDERAGYGISSVLFDRVFNTLKKSRRHLAKKAA